MALIDVRVVEVVDETPTVKSFRLERVDGKPLGAYQAGAHVDVVGPTAITRQYSLLSTPDDGDSYTVAVKRETGGRGGSEALHTLKVGDVLQISAPRNLMAMDDSAEHHVLVAAGIGITPMLSLARWMHVHGHSFELHYFARSSEDAAFLPLLQERCPEHLHTHFGIAVDAHDAELRDAFASVGEGTHIYVCGPAPFMDAVRRVGTEFIADEHIHQESFQAVEQPDASENTAFDVEFEDETYHIPADRSIVSVLQENGIDVDTSCEEGICGTCIMTVLEGEPEHRDNVLTKAEKAANEQIAICVSRCRGEKLVLDYF